MPKVQTGCHLQTCLEVGLGKMPVYRKQLQHFDDPFDAHELTFSCFQRRPFLMKDRSREWMIEALELGREKHHFHIWAYVIMPEHVHVLVWPQKEKYSVAQFLQTVKQSVSRKALRYVRTHAPDSLDLFRSTDKSRPFHFWQDGGGYDRNIISDDATSRSVDYIHNNPVTRGLVVDSLDWDWSSARAWNGVNDVPLKIDKDSFPILSSR